MTHRCNDRRLTVKGARFGRSACIVGAMLVLVLTIPSHSHPQDGHRHHPEMRPAIGAENQVPSPRSGGFRCHPGNRGYSRRRSQDRLAED
jgi:hypothetical protein